LEVEVKVKISEDEMRRLKAILEEKCGGMEELEMEDIYFSHPCYDFKERDEALRLRVERGGKGERAELTFKGRRIEERGVKAREEINADVLDWRKVLSILESLGFRKIAAVKKVRADFDCPSFKVSLDRVESLGTFAEIEGKEGCEAECVEEALRSLGVRGEVEKKTYLELILSLASSGD